VQAGGAGTDLPGGSAYRSAPNWKPTLSDTDPSWSSFPSNEYQYWFQFLNFDGDTIADVSYESEGCSISQASASVLTDLVIGRKVDDAMSTYDQFLRLMQSKGQLEPDEEVLEDAIAFAGVSKYPARVKCALLAWAAWRDAVTQVREGTS